MLRFDFIGYVEMIANPSFEVNNFAKRFEASTQKMEGVGGGNFLPASGKNRGRTRRLLVQSRTPKKSFVFLLERKMVARKIRNCKQNFSLAGRALASGGGVASFGQKFLIKWVRAQS